MLPIAPKCQPDSAITKQLVASGCMSQADVSVRVVAVFDCTARSCPAPRPRVIRTTAPRFALATICSVLLPTVVAAWIVAEYSG